MDVFRQSSLLNNDPAATADGTDSIGIGAGSGGIGIIGSGSGSSGLAGGSEPVSASQAWGALSEWLMRQYQVKAFPPNNTSTTSSSGGGGGGSSSGSSSYEQQQMSMVVLFGDQSNVDRSKNALAQLAEEHHRRVSRQQSSATERLRARQGAGTQITIL